MLLLLCPENKLIPANDADPTVAQIGDPELVVTKYCQACCRRSDQTLSCFYVISKKDA